MWKKVGFLVFINLTFMSSDGFTYQKVYKSTEICGPQNSHRKYLELGETGEILSHNITVPNYIQEVSKQFNQSLIMQCTLELVTCTSCSIKLKFSYINFLSNCPNPKNGGGICRCDYILLSEPPYDDKQRNILHNCGTIYDYQTKTRSLQIKFIYWNNYTDAFRMEYSVDQNREIITSQTSESNESHNDQQIYEIKSPFFPAFYPRDYAIEHIIKCEFEYLCKVKIEFSDFLIARSSSMEFIDTNGERFYVTGRTFRPPLLISSGSSVTIRFNANGGTDLGYKAKVWFISALDELLTPLSNFNCGGLVDTIGGVITMMNMSRKDMNESIPLLYDCIWLIKPPQAYLQIKSHISVRVENFEKMASDSEIHIHQGITSDKPLIEVLRSSPDKSVSSRNLVTPLSAGFYVRLRGKFNAESRLAIVYAAFSYSKCYTGNEFMCHNQRCISLMLQCDGFDHCGDNSDEPSTCAELWENSQFDRRWYSHTPNYYFPKLDRFPDFKPTTVAFIISSTSLLLVISCLIMMVYRNGNRIWEQEELQNQLQTISQLLDANNNNNRPEEIVEPPPIYENPPDYDEIIKIGMDEQMNRAKRSRASARKQRLNRPRSSDPAVSVQRSLLEVSAHEENDLPSTSSVGSSTYYINNEMRDNVSLPFQRIDDEETIEISPKNDEPNQSFTGGAIPKNISVSDIASQKIKNKNSSNESMSIIPSSSSILYKSSEPKHLWNEDSKFKKSWILFNSDDYSSSKASHHNKSFNNFQMFDSIDIAQMQEVDDYFQSYVASKAFFQSSQSAESFVSMKSCFCDSTQSIFSSKFKTSLLTNKTECDRCKNLIYQSENRRCALCGDCVEKLYSPKICMTCNGRISFQDLRNLSIKHQYNNNVERIDEIIAIKLCNCFPKYPSQNFSSIQSNDANEIQILSKISGKSCSYNEIVHQSRKKKSSSQYFSSHNCLPLKTSSSSDDDSSDTHDD